MTTEVSGKQVQAASGWTTWPPSAEPHLLGTRCRCCGDYFFPKAPGCRNPDCMSGDVEEVPLSRKGKLFSFSVNYYKPPAPFVSPDPFVPYATVIVELEKEHMMVQGMAVSGCDFDQLKIGVEMETVLEALYTDEAGNEVIVWKFKPA